MKHNEEQMLVKGEAVLKDVFGNSYREGQCQKAMFNPQEELLRGKAGAIAAWTVVIGEPVSDSFIFLTVSDETGEPLYIQTKHLVREITKDSNGRYIRLE